MDINTQILYLNCDDIGIGHVGEIHSVGLLPIGNWQDLIQFIWNPEKSPDSCPGPSSTTTYCQGISTLVPPKPQSLGPAHYHPPPLSFVANSSMASANKEMKVGNPLSGPPKYWKGVRNYSINLKPSYRVRI